jgi:hypothetical protein
MRTRQELRELMHCCRPDLSDLTEQEARALRAALDEDPVLRREWQAIQSWDAGIGRAIHEVPVPDGLADRLVAAVSACEPLPGEDADAVVPSDAGAAPGRAQESRRHWLMWPAGIAAGLLVTSALVMLALFLVGQQDDLTAAQLVEASGQWIEQLDQAAWRTVDPPYAEFPLDPSLRVNIVDWQPCTFVPDCEAVVYRAVLRQDRATAFVFVIHTRKGRQLPTIPPMVPDSTTGNVCVGVWKNNGCLYVLVVPGGPSDYLGTLRTQAVA